MSDGTSSAACLVILHLLVSQAPPGISLSLAMLLRIAPARFPYILIVLSLSRTQTKTRFLTSEKLY